MTSAVSMPRPPRASRKGVAIRLRRPDRCHRGAVRRAGERTHDGGAFARRRFAGQRDGRVSSTRLSFFRPSWIAATSSSLSARAAPRRSSRAACASASRRHCRRASAILRLSLAAGASRCRALPKCRCGGNSGRSIVDGPIGALVLAAQERGCRARADRDFRSVRIRQCTQHKDRSSSRWSARGRAIPIF